VADNGVDAGRRHTAVADLLNLALHLVHVGTGAANVADVALKTRHGDDLLDFFEDGRLGAARDKFPLVGRDRTKTAATETPTVGIDGELDHLKGRDVAALFVAGMRQARVRQVEGVIQFSVRHRRVGRVDDEAAVADVLQDAARADLVGLLLHDLEVGGVGALVFQAGLMAGDRHVLPALDRRQLGLLRVEEGRLGDVAQGLETRALAQEAQHLTQRLFAHAIDQHVGLGVRKDGREQLVGPIIVMGHAPQRGLDATDQHRHVRIKLLQDLGIDRDRIVWPESAFAAGCIGIRGALAFVGGVVVDHAVHAAARHAEEVLGCPEFLEVAQVVLPVGLGDDGHLKTLTLNDPPDDRRAKCRMIDIGIPGNDHDVELFPATRKYLVFGQGQPVG